MSILARQTLVYDRGDVFFQRQSQRLDLLNPALTRTELIALFTYIADMGVPIEFTAIRSDHSDDSALGPHSHANGAAADFWFLTHREPGAWLDAGSPLFRSYLRIIARSQWCEGIGLGGSANTPENMAACNGKGFPDDKQDHIHVQVTIS
jgi:hypothetical protein